MQVSDQSPFCLLEEPKKKVGFHLCEASIDDLDELFTIVGLKQIDV